ncbi:helix-turn-helix domain-containing protein [Streptomyces sp. HPF1205]|uniref:helix-turn-helix domain-containing protein n=1 Tax=Streptomyces sp. HPF1205 TaxID=2873262 RepID=UPI001CEDAC11|nr:helix-turn-helix domain-containing protein [Streptomyces sp. HPF1205]
MNRDHSRADTATTGRSPQRADDVLDMQRAARRGGTAQLLRWLAARTGAAVLLVNRSGTVASPPPSSLAGATRELVLRAVREVASRGLKSVAIDQEHLTCVALPLDGPSGVRAPLLAAVRERPAPPELPLLLADATSVLSLCWQSEYAARQQRRLRLADARNREAVLHLLMNGQVSAARQVAAALRPALPDVVRVYVIEGPRAQRDAVADAVAEAAQDAWVVPCPVYADHMMVLVSAGPGDHTTDSPPQGAWLPSVADACRIGVSEAVPLRDTATGYAQAFHALAAARHRTERQASFAGSPDLTLTIGPDAAAWAGAFLAPLRAHRARRSQDPDSAELLATATSWLHFASRAAVHLKIHRNTLTTRLALVQELLGLDLNRLADQAALDLALRTVTASLPPRDEPRPPGADGTPSLDQLLALPHVVEWAEGRFRPLRTPEVPACIAQTLTTWLRLDARIGPTAAALSLSASAVRKRLARSEVLLQRSFLRSPSAVHDQWLAQRALDLAGHAATRSYEPAPAA